MPQFEYVGDLIPATTRDLAQLDELLFDLDTHTNHTYGLIVGHEYRSADYNHFDESTFPPFEVRAWHQEFAGNVIICEINEGASIQSINDDEEEGEYLSTTDITDPLEHELAVQALRYELEPWETILPKEEALWLGKLIDFTQNPEEAAVGVYEILERAPYTKEIAVISSFCWDSLKNGILYKRTVANDAYLKAHARREAGTELVLTAEIDKENTLVYEYRQDAEGRRTLEITDGANAIFEKGVLTSGKVSRLCATLKELLLLEFGSAKIPRHK